jgi:nicotinate phosphoribosyltransferase
MSVVASNDINEETLRQLNADQHQIDVFGIGTNLVTCQAQPALGMVYKVVEFKNTPRIKFSEEIEKMTLPGSHSAIRVLDNGLPILDLICLASETHKLLALSPESSLTYYKGKSPNNQPLSLAIT